MKKLFYAFFLISLLGVSQRNEYIVIKHIGEQNTSVDPITILIKGSIQTKFLDKEIKFFGKYSPARDNRLFLDSLNFVDIGKQILNYSDSTKTKKPKDFPNFGSFKISYFKNDKPIKSYAIYSAQESIELFKILFSKNYPSIGERQIKLQFLACVKLTELEYHKSNCKDYY